MPWDRPLEIHWVRSSKILWDRSLKILLKTQGNNQPAETTQHKDLDSNDFDRKNQSNRGSSHIQGIEHLVYLVKVQQKRV